MDIYSSKPPVRAGTKKKKIGGVILVIWCFCLIVFGLSLYHVFSPNSESSSSFYNFVLFLFIAIVILLPIWGFLLGGKLVKILTATPLVIVALYLFSLRFVFAVHKLRGVSMAPNFKNGDYFISQRVAYYFNTPKRGDVIVFTPPIEETTDYIARIVGLPGEYISIRRGNVYINNKSLNESYTEDPGNTRPGDFIGETNILIPANKYAVMGDNRANSYDSRAYGFVDIGSISGKVFYIYWPAQRRGPVKNSETLLKETSFNSCRTLGTQMIVGPNGKGQIGCDVEIDGDFDLSQSYCVGQTTGNATHLIPDAFRRSNRYYATLDNLNLKEEVKVFVSKLNGEKIECLPSLNTPK